jgi:hypothetical protein
VSEGQAIGLQPNEAAAKKLQAYYALGFASQTRASAPYLQVSSRVDGQEIGRNDLKPTVDRQMRSAQMHSCAATISFIASCSRFPSAPTSGHSLLSAAVLAGGSRRTEPYQFELRDDLIECSLSEPGAAQGCS